MPNSPIFAGDVSRWRTCGIAGVAGGLWRRARGARDRPIAAAGHGNDHARRETAVAAAALRRGHAPAPGGRHVQAGLWRASPRGAGYVERRDARSASGAV